MAAIWFGIKLTIGGSIPYHVVVSGSMVPTLNVGDLLIVSYGGFESLKEGDIILFRSPYQPSKIIVHRIHSIIVDAQGIGLITKGDHNPAPDGWVVRKGHYMAKVVFSIPYVGFILSPPYNYLIVAAGLFLIFLLEYYSEEKKDEKDRSIIDDHRI